MTCLVTEACNYVRERNQISGLLVISYRPVGHYSCSDPRAVDDSERNRNTHALRTFDSLVLPLTCMKADFYSWKD